jgi:UDP-N-acetylmuramate--alanine ligase
VLAAAREGAAGRVIAVVQPHRFTRLQTLMDDFQGAFNDADIVYVRAGLCCGRGADRGHRRRRAGRRLKQRGHRMVRAVATRRISAVNCATSPARGDMVICLGAGDITKWAAGLADGIRQARLNK